MVYFGTRLSENISRREPEGYLICLNVPVARTGTQEYLPSELGMPGMDDRMIPVERTAEEVFSPACMASFEGMPVTDDHPAAAEGVTAENIRYLQKGHALNIRRGPPPEDDLLMADLIITDPKLIGEILDGKREISCGYNYVLSEEEGKYYQREIRGNHVAVVDAGRAGPRVSIKDSETKTKSIEGRTNMNRKNKVFARMMARMAKDGDTEALEEVIAEIMGEEPETVAAAVKEQGNAAGGTAPAAPVVVETPVEQPVIIDCGPEILEALQRIIALLGGTAGDCGNTERQEDQDPDEVEASVGVSAAEAAEAIAETVEATAEAVAQTVAEAMGMGRVNEDPLEDEDPIEELIEEILEETAGEEEEPVSEELLSTILEQEEEADENPEEEKEASTDALRAVLASFAPKIRKMSLDERKVFNARVAAKMKKMTRKNGKNPYAAIRDAQARDYSGRDLGEKIMKERNANRRV
ncbi:MAG: DUF2213 domain-containing protein [Clostridia bacterium]|nr:DUF2213 domain-containing protein [Clostridia bacterium]